MKISIIGTGYVGLVSGVCLSEINHIVTCIDIDKEKIVKLENGVVPFYEPGLEDLIRKNKDRLFFTTEFSSIKDSAIIMIAVGTPSDEDGNLNLKYLESAAKEIATNLKKEDGYKVVVIKSTVPPGTNEKIEDKIKSINPDLDFDICSNPEFLREGSAVYDFMNPDRIVIGAKNDKAFKRMESLYSYFGEKGFPIVNLELRSAELIKYLSNAYLAMRIAFANESATICEKLNLDPLKLLKGIGLDSRIGTGFFHPGPGYGGSCWPKDVQGLQHYLNTVNLKGLDVISSIHNSNENRKNFVLNNLINKINENNYKNISVLGLAFKKNTDDIRESPAIFIIKSLSQNLNISVYDPEAIENTKKELADFKNVTYNKSIEECCNNSDLIIIATEWDEFRGIAADNKNILDLRYL